jgi:hypothetical protein
VQSKGVKKTLAKNPNPTHPLLFIFWHGLLEKGKRKKKERKPKLNTRIFERGFEIGSCTKL